MSSASTSFEILDRTACLELLETAWLGRVGVSIAALPAILPVSYLLDGGSVAFRSEPGSKLEAIGRGEVVCFEVDHADRVEGTAWSVLVVGQARAVTDPVQRAALDERGADLWPPVDSAAWVCLDTSVISGRRFRTPEQPATR